MDLYHVKSCVYCAPGSSAVIFGNAFQLFPGKRAGELSAWFGRKGGSGDRLHTYSGRHSGCSCMVQLHAYAGAISVTGFCEIEKTGDIAVFINTKLCSSIGSFRIFYTYIFYNDKSCTAAGSEFIVFDVFVGELSGMSCEVASHRHHCNTVWHDHSSYFKRTKDMFEVVLHLRLPPFYKPLFDHIIKYC